MAAIYEDRGDRYPNGRTSPWSPEDNNITNQPQSLNVKKLEGNPAGCSHLKKIPFTTIVHDGTGHVASGPLDCFQCGQEVATILFKQLSLGVKDHQSTPALQFRDVMVLTQEATISDVSGMMQGLRDSRIPVRVVGEQEDDIIRNVGYVDEVVVTRSGLASTETSRRVMVLLQWDRSKPQPTLENFKPVLRQAEHVVWVRHPLGDNAATTDNIILGVEDGLAAEGTHQLLESSEDRGFGGKNHAGAEDDVVKEETRMLGEGKPVLGVTDQYLEDKARMMHAVTHSPLYCLDQPTATRSPPHRLHQPVTTTASSTKHSTTTFGHTAYNPNDCCDNFCLACCHDVGESGCIICCPCCDEIGTWCEACCRGFAHTLADCFCCSSGGDGGCGGDGCDCNCGDCDCNCGDCDCNCGDCNCDCGSCVIM